MLSHYSIVWYKLLTYWVSVQSLSCVWLFEIPSCPVHHQLLELGQTHVHWVGDAIQHLILCCPCFPCFHLSQHQGLFQRVSSSHQMENIGASASAPVLPMNIQDWFPLGLTDLISLKFKGLSRVFSTTIQKHQFFSAQPSLWSGSHIHAWLL